MLKKDKLLKHQSDLKIYDVSLRDGNHALRHALKPDFVSRYCAVAESSGVFGVEVGHGNGLGASSFLIGKASSSDRALLEAAREHLRNTKLGVHLIPGFATIQRDLAPAIELGVDVFRVGTHATEANTGRRHIDFLSSHRLYVQGVLMMSHTVDVETLVSQALLLRSYGASAVVIMDSAGNYVPANVTERISALVGELDCEIGFHAHNNLCVGVSNALAAIDAGATFIDGSAMGLGAGAGNASLEGIIANLLGSSRCKAELSRVLDLSSMVEKEFRDFLPLTTSSSIRSGLAGVFSGFAPHVQRIAQEYGLTQEDLWAELGKRRLVAGQESMIREVALDLMNL